jgi:hypothetical protein
MTTENHGLEIPSKGTLDWDRPLNENFQQIDTGIEMRDTEANIDQYAPKQGAKFLAIDTGARYIGDGNQWTTLPVQNPTNFVAQSVTTDPDNAVSGTVWYREDLDEIRVQAGSSVKTIAPIDTQTDSGAEPLVQNSLDTQTDIDDFWVNVKSKYHSEKVEAVSSPAKEGSGSMRINIPGGDFYGTEGYHYVNERPEYPDSGLTECHIRYYAMLDSNFDIDNPWAGQQMGKGFPGFDGRFENDLSDDGGANGTNGWLINGAVWSADKIGGDPDDWVLAQYVYHADQDGKYGDSFFPDTSMSKRKWYQIDRYFKMNSGKNTDDGILRQWQDGELVFEKTDFNYAWESPYDKLYAIRNLWYYGGGWGAPDASGDNHAYTDNIQVFDSEQAP